MKKSKSFLCFMLIFLFSLSTVFGKGQNEEKDSGKNDKEFNVGFVQTGPEFYYQRQADGFKAAMETAGVNTTVLNSEGNAEKERANIELLVTKNVDAIAMFATSSNGAQQAAQLCNDADIPLFLLAAPAADGPGKVASTISYSWEEMGRQIGNWIVNNYPQETNVAIIEGIAGQEIANLISKGCEDALKNSGIEVIAKQPADWDRLKAMAVMQDMLTANLDIDIVYVHNEDMAAGVVQVLKESNKLNNPIKVVSNNGSPEGIEMIKDGDLLATCANSPSYEGAVAAITIYDYLNGKKIPEKVSTPLSVNTKETVDEINTWEIDTAIRAMNEHLNK